MLKHIRKWLDRAPQPVVETPPDESRSSSSAAHTAAAMRVHGRRLAIQNVEATLNGVVYTSRFEPDSDALDLEIEVEGEWMAVPARVVRISFEHGLYRIAAAFLDVAEAQRAHLVRFISQSVRVAG